MDFTLLLREIPGSFRCNEKDERRSLPKKRHEAWQLLEGREQRRLVASMALLLRMAVALDRRPQPVVAGIQVRRAGGQAPALQAEVEVGGHGLQADRTARAAVAVGVAGLAVAACGAAGLVVGLKVSQLI